MSQAEMESALQEVERNRERFERALNEFSEPLGLRSKQAGEFVGRADSILRNPKKIVDDYVSGVVSHSVRDAAVQAQEAGDQVIEYLEEGVLECVQTVQNVIQDGLRFQEERPFLVAGMLFAIGLFSGFALARKGLPPAMT